MITAFDLENEIDNYLMELYTKDSIDCDQYRDLCRMISEFGIISYAEGVVYDISK